MKKILILILIILLGVIAYMIVYKNIEIGNWKSTNLEELKALKMNLDDKIKQARELNETEYTNKIDELNKSTKQLKRTKETYETKMKYLDEDLELGLIKVKEYKIEYLWAIIQNYARDEGIQIKLDLIENGANDLYNINITAKGHYQYITNFIEKVERDDTLDFKIEDFKLTPITTTTSTGNSNNGQNSTTQKVTADTTNLQATFTIKNVKIVLTCSNEFDL